MPRYKRRPTLEETTPGLFDELELDMTVNDFPSQPSIEEHLSRVKLSGGLSGEKSIAVGSDIFCEPVKTPDTSGRMRFISFGSGSSGNCAYIGDEKCGFLIDAGIDNIKVSTELKRHGIKMESVRGVILTHDHGDHVRYIYKILRKHNHIGLYCTPKVLSGMLRRHNLSRRLKDYHKPIYKEFPFKIGDFSITAFDVSHDGTDNSGFFIELGDHRFVVATDLGIIGPRADFYIRQARYLMIESNYDHNMLVNGHYKEYLKARILADNGHLDNIVAAEYVASIYTPTLSHVFLCHLSNDNNTPEIATEAMVSRLKGKGLTIGDGSESIESRDADIQVMPLPRFDFTRMFIFR